MKTANPALTQKVECDEDPEINVIRLLFGKKNLDLKVVYRMVECRVLLALRYYMRAEQIF